MVLTRAGVWMAVLTGFRSRRVQETVRRHRQPHVPHGSLSPAPVSFRGMPSARFWEFEDGAANFASVQAAPQDLGLPATPREVRTWNTA